MDTILKRSWQMKDIREETLRTKEDADTNKYTEPVYDDKENTLRDS